MVLFVRFCKLSCHSQMNGYIENFTVNAKMKYIVDCVKISM